MNDQAIYLGVKTEPSSQYHALRDFISSTPLRKMDKSAAHFHHAWTKEDDEDKKESQEIGTLLHDLLLEQDVAKYVARPLKDDGELVRSNAKEYKDFLAANSGKTPIRPELFNQLYTALTSFADNKLAMKLLKGAKIEHSVYAIDHETGLKIKARPDIWGCGFICDLKSSTTPLDETFVRRIFSAGHDFQLAHYDEVIKAATRETITDHYILAFEQKAPFASRVYRINRVYIAEAKTRRRQYLNEIAVCQSENRWPSFREEIIEVVRPVFLDKSTEISFDEAAG